MLHDQIKADIITAMKEKNEVAKNTLRLLSTALKNEAIALQKELSDEDAIKVLSREVKRLKEGAKEFVEAKREDLAEAAHKELKIFERYMPAQLSDEDIEVAVQQVIDDLKATAQDMGKVMGMVMKKVGSSADGTRVKEIVQKLLT